MTRTAAEIERSVEQLLADDTQPAAALREALAELWDLYVTQVARLDRIAHLSDRYQSAAREEGLARSEQFEKRLNRLEKMTRISDRYQDMMRELNLALQHASSHDLLTELPNRRLLGETLKREAARAARHGTPLSVAIADVDHFKRINDCCGHDVGDEVLRELAAALRHALRESDFCGRWGGEEFLVLLPESGLDQAQGVLERLCAVMRGRRFAGLPAERSITLSIGVAQWDGKERPDAAITRADMALLEAKRNGRDRVLAAPSP